MSNVRVGWTSQSGSREGTRRRSCYHHLAKFVAAMQRRIVMADHFFVFEMIANSLSFFFADGYYGRKRSVVGG